MTPKEGLDLVAIGLMTDLSSEPPTMVRPSTRFVAPNPHNNWSTGSGTGLPPTNTKTLPLDWPVANPCTVLGTFELPPKILCYSKWRTCNTTTRLQMRNYNQDRYVPNALSWIWAHFDPSGEPNDLARIHEPATEKTKMGV